MATATKKLRRLEQRMFTAWRGAVSQLADARQRLATAEPADRPEAKAIFEMCAAQTDAAWEHWHTALGALDELDALRDAEANGRH